MASVGKPNEQLLSDFQDSHAAHFTYDRGILEIMVLSFKHETVNRTLAQLVSVIAEEMQVDIINAGSTTFKRRDIAQGFEPDSCFYIQNEGRISGKAEIDLDVDPPPDLIIEIDITSPLLNKAEQVSCLCPHRRSRGVALRRDTGDILCLSRRKL